MDDFFKNIKDNLGNRPEPDFDPNGWADMENRMAKPEPKTRGMIAWWWLPATLLPMMLLNFYLLQKNTALAASNNFETQKSVLEIRTDTIYKTQVVYQTDTVYRTEIRYEKIEVPVDNRYADAKAAEGTGGLNTPGLIGTLFSKNPSEKIEEQPSNSLSDYNPSGFFNRTLEVIKNENGGLLFTNTNTPFGENKDAQNIDNQQFNYDFSKINLVEKLPIELLE